MVNVFGVNRVPSSPLESPGVLPSLGDVLETPWVEARLQVGPLPLDHPNIVQVFSVEEAEGVHFITMQLVQGKTLTELLPKSGFPLNKFFDIAIPMADAVAAAHQEGITHRDLKPDNMMVGDDGRIRVLDFGLAKPTSGFVAGDADSALPTAAKTAEGVIVGTVNYMSPEQAQGKDVDHRSEWVGRILRNIIHPKGEYTFYYGERPEQFIGEAIEVPSRLSAVLVRVEVRDKNDPEDVTAARAVYKGMTITGNQPAAFPQLDLLSGYPADVADEADRRTRT